MVYCVTLNAAFSSTSRRDAVLGDIQTRIANRARWSVDILRAQSVRLGGVVQANGIYVELRFVSQADADDLKARVETFATGQRAPLAGSTLTVHDCTHDDGTDACAVVASRTW